MVADQRIGLMFDWVKRDDVEQNFSIKVQKQRLAALNQQLLALKSNILTTKKITFPLQEMIVVYIFPLEGGRLAEWFGYWT